MGGGHGVSDQRPWGLAQSETRDPTPAVERALHWLIISGNAEKVDKPALEMYYLCYGIRQHVARAAGSQMLLRLRVLGFVDGEGVLTPAGRKAGTREDSPYLRAMLSGEVDVLNDRLTDLYRTLDTPVSQGTELAINAVDGVAAAVERLRVRVAALRGQEADR
jgi:hypothetical protein